jgi:hypothetical protein
MDAWTDRTGTTRLFRNLKTRSGHGHALLTTCFAPTSLLERAAAAGIAISHEPLKSSNWVISFLTPP